LLRDQDAAPLFPYGGFGSIFVEGWPSEDGGRVQNSQVVAATFTSSPGRDRAVGLGVGRDIPQHAVGIVQQHRRVDGIAAARQR
jgi:hypothetical protein